jgi:hypothetical protein
MSEFTPLREAVDALASRSPSPEFGELRQRAIRRGRRRITLVTVAAAAAVATALGITAVVTNGQQGRDGLGPAGQGTPTSSVDPDWPLERIRAEGIVEEEYFTASGIAVRLWGRCDESLPGPDNPEEEIESVCAPGMDPPIRRAHSHLALEVTQNGRFALFSTYGDWAAGVVAAYGDDAVLYSDSDYESDVQDLRTDRYRLLRADGSEMQLKPRMDSPVPAVPGPDVVVLHLDRGAAVGTNHPFVIDEDAGTLRPLGTYDSAEYRAQVERELGAWYPETGLSWGPNTDQSLWFVYHDCTVHWGSGEYYGDGGTFERHQLDCAAGFDSTWGEDDFTYLTDDMFPAGWLQPGRMAAIENSDGQLFLHVTLDQGDSWERIPVDEEAAIPDTLRQLG